MNLAKSLTAPFFCMLLAACSGYKDVRHKWCNHETIEPKTNNVKVRTVTVNINADATFAFDGSKMKDITSQGRNSLDALISEIREKENTISSIDVIGNTDRLGMKEYNYKLGLRRANTIKEYLIEHDVLSKINTSSNGASNPVVECQIEKDEQLKKCLQPNRRVNINIHLKE